MVMDTVPPPKRSIPMQHTVYEWERDDGEIIIPDHMVEGAGRLKNYDADPGRQAILEARRKRNAELKAEALNNELRELNDNWGAWN